MLDDFQRERLEAEAKADQLVNDLCKAAELKRSLESQDPMWEINAQIEALEPKTNPETFNHLAPVLEDSSRPTLSQKLASITTLARATCCTQDPGQVPTSIVVHEVEPTEGPDLEPPMLIQEQEEEVLPMTISDHLLNCVKDTPPEELVLEEIEPTTYPQDSNVQEPEESIDEEIRSTEEPITSIDNHASSEDLDQTFFDSLLDECDFVCPNDNWSQKSWDELLVSDTEDSSVGERIVVIIKPQMDSQPVEDKEEINLAMKANDVDQLRRLPPPPTYTKSSPYILFPPSRRNESRILDLDRAKYQTMWHQKRVKRAKLYDSRIGKSRKKWMPHRSSYPTVDRNEVQLIDAASRTRFDEWGYSRVLHESVCLAQDTLTHYGYAEEMEELLEGTIWQRLLQIRMIHTLITADTTFAFTLAGQSFQLTVREMGVRLGLYTQEETEQPEFYDNPFCLPADFDAIASGGSTHLTTRISSTRRVRTHLVCGFVITLLFRSLVGNSPIPRPVQLMRDLDDGMLRNAHIHRRLFPSSSESTTASTGRTSHEMGESSGSDHEDDASTSSTNKAKTNDGSDFKVDVPTFEGKNNMDEFLELLEKVERIFNFKEVSDEKKVKIVALKFHKDASTWWTNTCTKWRRNHKEPVATWAKMKSLLKKKFLPAEYVRENFAKLQTLKQGSKSLEEYTREFEELFLSSTNMAKTNDGSDFKVDVPTFEGKNNLDEFLELLEKVERIFNFKEVSDEKKVKIVALKFHKDASTWWTNTCTKWRRNHKEPVATWAKMKSFLKKKFLPAEYVRENFAKLQTLKQGSKSLEEYTRKVMYP
ncbi:unnamed protein product [Cuscuta campestris]|uniref:Retrotransposon gag domain-containing protein n=1 Tax=Cuscuta campestris TaxID=132261 RepID=A0A484MMX0_9ASTE|nr:unnamed protein product [Cuscuta campestris]